MRCMRDRDLAKHLPSLPLSLHSSLNFLPRIQGLLCICQLPWLSLEFALLLGNSAIAHWGCWCWYPLFSTGRCDRSQLSLMETTLQVPCSVLLQCLWAWSSSWYEMQEAKWQGSRDNVARELLLEKRVFLYSEASTASREAQGNDRGSEARRGKAWVAATLRS